MAMSSFRSNMPARPSAAAAVVASRRAAAALALLVLGVAMAAPRTAAAHELGPFQVFGHFLHDGSFHLDVKVDDEHLPAAQMGGPARITRYGRIAGLGGVAEQRFGRFLSDLADSLTLRFDGTVVAPSLRMDPDVGDPAAPARVTMIVEGWLPGGARTFTLETALAVKTYPLVLNCEGDEVSSWKWVEGGKPSPPYALAANVVPPPRSLLLRGAFERGFASVLPYGPAWLLAVAVLFLLVRRPGPALVLLSAFALGGGGALALALHGGGGPPLRPALLAALEALAVVGLALACLAAPPWPWRPRPLAALLPAAVCAAGALYGLDCVEMVRALPGRPPAASPMHAAAAAACALGTLGAALAVLAAACALVGVPLGAKPWYRSRVVVPASCLIAVIGLYWSVAALLA
jgi:hypothetical protein